ncbi:MAG TPA: mannose-1-phosphate guanylyltransferase [Acidobacteriaceae bacterium]|nr:mannose-1-phosphate guanylyltransferase [Acidobacteriaceae bacterium]
MSGRTGKRNKAAAVSPDKHPGSHHPEFAAVILAGGSGTRFWPRSRRARPKQVLSLDGDRTMIQNTVERVKPIVSSGQVWIITNDLLASTIAHQLPDVAGKHILREPAARNTAPACGLAAFLLERHSPDTVLGVFPSDHTIGDVERFRRVVCAGAELARRSAAIVVLGVSPSRPETGYGYIELGAALDPITQSGESIPVRRVHRFTEKPDKTRAKRFLRSGNYAWNSGMFLWTAKTLADAMREHQPKTAAALEEIASAWGTPRFEKVLAELYPQCESISIDYAVLEPRSAKGEGKSELYCLPGDFAWSDLGSWAALHEHVAERTESHNSNVVEAEHHVEIASTGCYVFSPRKTVALVGVKDLVVVETEDAILITTREGSQDVGKVVAELKSSGRQDLT